MLGFRVIKPISVLAVLLATAHMPGIASSSSTPAEIHPPIKQNSIYVQVSEVPPTPAKVSDPSLFQKFAPQPQANFSTINYEIWDLALENIVLRLGQSIRIRARRPDPLAGTRIVKGHKSGYRLEGSRITFSYLNEEYRQGLTAYRKDLEALANDIDITRLSRNEQLAFWLNLHNVTLIEQIAANYPVRRPEKLLIGAGKQPLNEAKLLNIRGVALSLRDIREKIVFPNWSDPDVIYGFFRGNIGGPALQNYAFTGYNVHFVLDIQGNEFVNSLRGVNATRSSTRVSAIYEEARPYYFINWPLDLKAHLNKFADPEVLEILQRDKPIEFDRYDPIVADLHGGDTPSLASITLLVNGEAARSSISPEVARLLRELESKTEIMRKRGMLKTKSKVIIEDIETTDVDVPDTDE